MIESCQMEKVQIFPLKYFPKYFPKYLLKWNMSGGNVKESSLNPASLLSDFPPRTTDRDGTSLLMEAERE